MWMDYELHMADSSKALRIGPSLFELLSGQRGRYQCFLKDSRTNQLAEVAVYLHIAHTVSVSFPDHCCCPGHCSSC
jgi:hypothetical protein